MFSPIRRIFLPVVMLTAACTTVDKDAPRAVVTVDPPTKADVWEGLASAPDKLRIQRIATGWVSGLQEARRAGNGGDIRAEGRLLDPDAGLERPAPTPGSYNCRMVTLGREGAKGPAYQKFKPFFCFVQVDRDLLAIVKQTGSKRPAGRLWEDDDSKRLIFLGTMALGNEEEAKPYGEDAKRDMAGVFERIGSFRWRLVIPYPRNGAKIDVFELTPVADQPTQ
nr:DUF4893 domain-containing protein [uncultured Sphingomonas sp.]